MSRYYLNTEMTSFTRGENLIAWFPLKATVLQVNMAGLKILEELQKEGITPTGENLAFLDGLADLDLLSREKISPPVKTSHEASEEESSPLFTSLTLFLTSACNLACTYCYAGGGPGGSKMSPQDARNAITWMARHCADTGNDELHLAFHGAGEPTLAGSLLSLSVDHALNEAQTHGLENFFSIGTNGVMDDEIRRLLVAHDFDVSLSLDGPETYHNLQRPLEGGNSFREAMRTAEIFTDADLPFAVRTTVTADNLASLPGFVSSIFEKTSCEIIQLEPLYLKGRGTGKRSLLPDPLKFIEIFDDCMDRAAEYDAEVSYSGISYPDRRERFCQACGSSICVTPEGDLTSCYESAGLTGDDPFHFGHIDKKGNITIDEKSYQHILTMDMLRPQCRTCIARYHCAGDCPSKMTMTEGSDTYRCTINRQLLKLYILRHLESSGEGRIEFN